MTKQQRSSATANNKNKRINRRAKKLYYQHYKQKIGFGIRNTPIILYATVDGLVMRSKSSRGASSIYSMDLTVKYKSTETYFGNKNIITTNFQPDVFENQHYKTGHGNFVKNTRPFYMNNEGQAMNLKRCTTCDTMKDFSEFNSKKYQCRVCQASDKAIYVKTDGAKLSNRKRRDGIRATSDGTVTRGALKQMLKDQDHKCVYCNTDIYIGTAHHDHIHPISKGGEHKISNIQMLCPSCNIAKSNNLDFVPSEHGIKKSYNLNKTTGAW